MTSSQLPNYLLAHRKRLALSQKEVAFLLGAENGAKVCRYERFAREPSLATVLAYEAIFQKPARELFAGLYQQVEAEVAARAASLSREIEHAEPTQETAHKRQLLADIAALPVKPINNPA